MAGKFGKARLLVLDFGINHCQLRNEFVIEMVYPSIKVLLKSSRKNLEILFCHLGMLLLFKLLLEGLEVLFHVLPCNVS